MTGRSMMIAMASVAILVLVGMRLLPEGGYGAGIATHASRGSAWAQPITLAEDAADALPDVSKREFRLAAVPSLAEIAAPPSHANERPSPPPLRRARSHIERAAASTATPAEPH